MSAPYIAPLAPNAAIDPELQALLAQCAALGVPDATFTRILARVPAYAKALLRAMLVSHVEGNIDHRLKEIIRLQLARTAGDGYFGALRSSQARQQGLDEARIAAGAADFEADTHFTPAEKWALRYARELYTNPENVTPNFMLRANATTAKRKSWSLGLLSPSTTACKRGRAR